MQLGECNRPVQELSGGLDRISRESRGDQARKSGAGRPLAGRWRYQNFNPMESEETVLAAVS